jgi:hypothetical protein
MVVFGEDVQAKIRANNRNWDVGHRSTHAAGSMASAIATR